MTKRREPYVHLSRRETQIMEVVYALGEASVHEVRDQIADSPSYNSVRVILGILEEKGFVTHRKDGRRYVYHPKRRIEGERRSAMRQMLNTFFGGSTPKAVSAFIDLAAADLTAEELDGLARQIRKAKKEKNG